MLYVLFKLFRPEGHRTEIEVYNVRCINTVKALVTRVLQLHEASTIQHVLLKRQKVTGN